MRWAFVACLTACSVDCPAGFGDCDGLPTNGCETSLLTFANCGACGRTCAAGEQCLEGRCGVPPLSPAQCGTGFYDCDFNPANGCETPESVDACGGCGMRCPRTNATAACSAGMCSFECLPGYADCTSDHRFGCLTHLDDGDIMGDNVENCGMCGHRCTYAAAHAACIAGACSLASCQTGFGDCNGQPADGCEATLAVDPNHCGRCGHSCLGGTCQGGHCASLLLDECPVGNRLDAPSRIAVDATDVYWICAAADGSLGIVRVARDGSSRSVLASEMNTGMMDLALSADSVYYTLQNDPNAAVMKVPKAGGTPTIVAPSQWPTSTYADEIVVDDANGNIYWIEQPDTYRGSIMEVGLGGGTPIVRTTYSAAATALVMDDANLYWAESIATAPQMATLRYLPKAGGGAGVVALGVSRPSKLGIQGGFLYWADYMALWRVSTNGGTPQMLPSSTCTAASLIAVDDTSFYSAAQGHVCLLAPDGSSALVVDDFSPLEMVLADLYLFSFEFVVTSNNQSVNRLFERPRP